MIRTRRFHMIFVTAPDRKTARAIAGKALKARLAACVNLVPNLESHYWWKGKVESGREILMIFKTSTACVSDLEALIKTCHPYETPEFVMVQIAGASREYLAWLKAACIGKRFKSGEKVPS